MLDMIKSEIEELQKDTTPFDVVFQKYVMEVQDANIDEEFSYMLLNNVVSIELLDRAIIMEYQRMVPS